MRNTKNINDYTENHKMAMNDEKYAKIIKIYEDYRNDEKERITKDADNRIEKMKERIKLEKEEKIKRIEEDSNIWQERMEKDIRKEQRKEIEILDEYVNNEIAKIDARKKKEILEKTIIKIENFDETIPLKEDSIYEEREKKKNKKEKNKKKNEICPNSSKKRKGVNEIH